MVAANGQRGEIVANLDGEPRRLCLTLGSLAELETRFGADGLSDLAARLSTGRLSASDIAAIVAAGLRGGGDAAADETAVEAMRCDDGIAGFARIVARLLVATFGGGEEDGSATGPFDDTAKQSPPTVSAPIER